MQLNRKILNLRLDRKLTSSAIAHACKVSNGTISKVETGRSLPDSKTLFLIARFLGVTVEYLLDENQPYPYQPLSTTAPLFCMCSRAPYPLGALLCVGQVYCFSLEIL